MFSKVKDSIGRSILIVFLIKPSVDLLYFAAFFVGPVRLSPTTVFAALMFVWFLRFRLRRGRHVAPYSSLLELFIFLHLISIFVGFYVGERITPVGVINISLRILDSYLVYVAAFVAMNRYQYQSIEPFVKAIVLGSAIAVFLNVGAIEFGFGGGVKGGGQFAALRERGLYYDPGALSNVAFFNLVFSVFLLHLVKRRKLLWRAFIVILIFADLYLVNAGKSRAVMIELAVFGFVYLWMFQKKWGKIAAPIAAATTLLVAVTILEVDFSQLFVRFETDIAALEEAGDADVGTSMTGDVELGEFERLGSNRGANWAEALTEISNRSALEILVGNFTTSVAHSDYVDTLSRNGAIGLVMYLVLLAGLVLRTWRHARRSNQDIDTRVLHFIAFTLIACYVLYAIPFRPLEYTTTAWYMWVMLGFSMSAAQRRLPQAAARQAERNRPATASLPARP